jgi:hypothetical protein
MDIDLNNFRKQPKKSKRLSIEDEEEFDTPLNPDFVSESWSSTQLDAMRKKIRKCVCGICRTGFMLNSYEEDSGMHLEKPSDEESKYVYICRVCFTDGWRAEYKRRKGKLVRESIMGWQKKEY